MAPFRIIPLVVLAVLTIVLRSLTTIIKEPTEAVWMSAAFGPMVCGLAILIWWFVASGANWREKWWGAGGFLLAAVITTFLLDSTMQGPGMIFLTIPMGILGFAVGLTLVHRWLHPARMPAAIAICAIAFGFSILLRNEGMWGDGKQEFRWRWTPTAEEQMLAARVGPGEDSPKTADVSAKSAWPGFRGPNRDGRQSGVQFSADWSDSAPEEIWRIPIGPGWSSFAVQGDFLFTQEQRGPDEFLTCYHADSGVEIWSSRIEGRFDDPMGGPGPRATPQLADDRIFALSATGKLLCANPVDGNIIWVTDIGEAADRKPPMWGFSSSPLVTNGLVVVHAGGKENLGTLGFDAVSGELSRSARDGDQSYSSPQSARVAGEEVILMATNEGLKVLDPETLEIRLDYQWPHSGYRALQPQVIDGDSIVIATDTGTGSRRIRLSKTESGLAAEEVWTNLKWKSDFNDFVVHDGHAYGFAGSIFSSTNLETGELNWKGGRYGKGQVLLLADSGLLLVIGERGEGVLIKATPNGHEELATAQILNGKSWSHPVVVGDKLFVRNSQEAVCFRLPTHELAASSSS
ncbi:MAG: PQQ-binding-like beta-propeller repeat protein [Verrucomicrobiota bacterium]